MSPKPCTKNRLLIVDDDPIIGNLFSVMIRANLPDLRIDKAANGAIAVDAFEKDHHAVIIMDLRMPVMNGLQAFQAIESKCNEKAWNMPSVVFCTGFVPPAALQQIEGFGETHTLLHKPVKTPDLVQAIRERM